MMLSLGSSEVDSEIGNQKDFLGSIRRKPVVEEWGGEKARRKHSNAFQSDLFFHFSSVSLFQKSFTHERVL